MTATLFNALSTFEQMEIIWERGVFLAEREGKEFRYILYQVDGFYIEEMRSLNWNLLYPYRCFDDPSLLEAYFDGIKIIDIFK